MGGIDGAKAPAVFEQHGGGAGHAFRGEVSLVPGQALGFTQAFQRRAVAAVGRVAHRQGVSPRAQRPPGVAHVHVVYLYARFQPIEGDAAPGHVGDVALKLHGLDGERVPVPGHQQRDGPRAAAQVHGAIALARRGEIRQQHAVRAEAEGVRALDQLEAVQLQIVQSLAGFEFHRHSPNASSASQQ